MQLKAGGLLIKFGENDSYQGGNPAVIMIFMLGKAVMFLICLDENGFN
jgi:hypothetical protein